MSHWLNGPSVDIVNQVIKRVSMLVLFVDIDIVIVIVVNYYFVIVGVIFLVIIINVAIIIVVFFVYCLFLRVSNYARILTEALR